MKRSDGSRLSARDAPAIIVANRGSYSASGRCCKRERPVRRGEGEELCMMPVPVTMVTTAACALLNMWLGWRVGQYRARFKVSVGDGGEEPLLRRMRAQAN